MDRCKLLDRCRQRLWRVRVLGYIRSSRPLGVRRGFHVSEAGSLAFQVIKTPLELGFLLPGMLECLPQLSVILFQLVDSASKKVVYDFELADACLQGGVLLLKNFVGRWRLEMTVVQGCGRAWR